MMKFLVLFALVAGAFASSDDCPANAHYEECGTACPITCDNYENPPKVCVLMCKSGCFCDEGYVETEEGNCVKPERCESEKKNCVDKPEPGMCRGYFPMFYYDEDARECKQFIYGGCQGNGNRYATKEQCLKKCASIWKSDSDRCSQPAETGLCRGYFPRFYFDKAAGQCKRFVYGGCGGNENNFKTEEECESACGNQAVELCGENERFTGCGTTCPLTCENYDNPPKICNLMCKIGCECEPGFVRQQNGKCVRPEQCPNRQAALDRPDCDKKAEPGLCRAYIPRYYYDQEAGQCLKFIYGGCGGNRNNFATEDECYNKCGGQLQYDCPKNSHYEACGSPCSITCKNHKDPPKKCSLLCASGCHCDKGYVWKGTGEGCVLPEDCPAQKVCGENEIFQECSEACPLTCDNYDTSPKTCDFDCKFECECVEGYVRNASGECIKPDKCKPKKYEFCDDKVDAGICRGYFTMWYYDGESKDCKKFIYGGCLGNGNRFPSEEECLEKCAD